MANITLGDENTLNVTLSDPIPMNSEIIDNDNVNVNTSDGWYESEYKEKDPLFTQSTAFYITQDDVEKWNSKADSPIDYSVIENTPYIPTNLSDLNDDSTHRFVSDNEKEIWNNKLDSSDLTDYVKFTDYATKDKSGVVKVDGDTYGILFSGANKLMTRSISYDSYLNQSQYYAISKGTLDNVIAGKGLVSKTDYATADKSGVIKASGYYNITTDLNGLLYSYPKTYEDYQSMNNNAFISKGTLENVIAGKQLVSNTDYATTNTGGVLKIATSDGFSVTNIGYLRSTNLSYQEYQSRGTGLNIGKGTLENVIAGKQLVDKTALDSKQDEMHALTVQEIEKILYLD